MAKLVASTGGNGFDFIVQPFDFGSFLIFETSMDLSFLDEYGSVLEDKYLPRRRIQLQRDRERRRSGLVRGWLLGVGQFRQHGVRQ